MNGPELEIEFSAYYNEKKEKFDEGGLYPFLEYCQSSKPKDVVVRVDYDMAFDEIDVYCESLGISKLSYEKTDGPGSNFIARFTCDSKSGKPLMRVIYALGEAGNGGHSYGFTVGKQKFYFDGDGADRIMKINGVKFNKIKNTYDLGKVWNDTTRKNNEESDNDIMSKNIVKINEIQLRNLIKESVRKVLKESLGEISSDMINRASAKFYGKYGWNGTERDKLEKDEHGNPLHPKDKKPLAQHFKNFADAFKRAKEDEDLSNPLIKKAQELYDQVDLEQEVADWTDGYSCDVNLWGEIEDENGGVWKFEGWGYGVSAGGGDIEIDSVEEMNFESPDGQTGSIPRP